MSDSHINVYVTAVLGLGIGYLIGKNNIITNPFIENINTQDKDQLNNQNSIIKNNIKPNPIFTQLARKQTIDDINITNKRVLVRVDYNVPIKIGVVTDYNRIESTLPTLKKLLENKPKCIVLLAHWGQPPIGFKKEEWTLEPAAKVLQLLMPNNKVVFLNECVGSDIENQINATNDGTIFLLENLRFHIEETGSMESEDKKTKIKAKPEDVVTFKKQLKSLGDVFIFEAFGASHRPHASVSGIEMEQRVSGLLVQKELKFFSQVLSAPQRPFVAILGGAKISDKILVIKNLLQVCDHLIIGGGMAYTFKKVNGMKIGKSLYDIPGAEHVCNILKEAAELGVQIHLPDDHVIADGFNGTRVGITDDESGIPDEWMGLDIGPKSRARFSKVLSTAKTVLWNGPMGVFEKPSFAAGTLSVMADLVFATKRGAVTVVGGGDTGAAAEQFYFQDKPCSEVLTHVSTGGGSSLVLMEGKDLPGVSWLTENK